jgi:uncharacterized protein
MNLERKLKRLQETTPASPAHSALQRQLDYLRKLDHHVRTLPAERFPLSIEEYVEGEVHSNARGEYFLARQTLPFGRPYGKVRIGDVASADLRPLDLFLAEGKLPPTSSIAYLDTETTGLVGGTGTCAFLIGMGAADGSAFHVRQFFLRELDEEKAVLAALADALEPYQAIITFNGKTFDLPLLETRFTMARMKSPFRRLLHLDLLHPARRLWKLRLERCDLKRLERELLKVKREGDVDGADIPQIYFNYLRTRNPRGLQPVFFHNALDIVSLAALAAELSRALVDLAADHEADGRDLFSLSRIFLRSGDGEKARAAGERAMQKGVPESIAPRVLWHLAAQHKRERRFDQAVNLWHEIIRRDSPLALSAYEELAIHYEHRERNPRVALSFAESAREHLRAHPDRVADFKSIGRRIERLLEKSARQSSTGHDQ